MANIDWVRRVGILVLLALAWEAYGRFLGNPLMLPTFTEVMRALWEALTDGIVAQYRTDTWWPGYSGGPDNSRYFSSSQIDARTVELWDGALHRLVAAGIASGILFGLDDEASTLVRDSLARVNAAVCASLLVRTDSDARSSDSTSLRRASST
mgnify:CR=1 FL=1